MSDFGDIELADAWDEESTIDPLQLAMRLHHLRRVVDELVGRDTPEWDDLDPDERHLSFVVAVEAVGFIEVREPDNPALLAEDVHEVRVRDAGRTWDELTNDERQIAIDFMILILAWLEQEGPR